jgi:hypothetical protein
MSMAADQVILSESDLEKNHYVELGETETLFVYIAPSVTVAADSEEAKAVEEANKRYAALLNLKLGADKFADNESQTLDLLRKGREVQSEAEKAVEFECQATVWDIADAMDAIAEVSQPSPSFSCYIPLSLTLPPLYPDLSSDCS